MAGGDFLASEATTASKQPRRSDLTSDLKSVTSITYISMCILLICFGPILRPFWWPQRPLQPPNGLKAQMFPQIWNLWPKLHMQPCLFGLFRPSLEVSQKKKKIKKMNRPLLDLSASPQVKAAENMFWSKHKCNYTKRELATGSSKTLKRGTLED